MKRDDKRFYLGWAAAAIMLGITLIILFVSSDAVLSLGTFMLGLGIILIMLAFADPKSTALAGFGATIGLLGIVVSALRAAVNPLLIGAGVLIAVGFGIVGYAYVSR